MSEPPGSAPATRIVRAFGGYQPGLDGMRAFGMMAVLLYHANSSWAIGSFVSVSQFFTVSGFLITAILLGEQGNRGSIDLRRYWVRRFRRLMPAALLGLLLVALYGAFAADRPQTERLTGEVFAAATYWVNWKFILADTAYVDQFASPSPVQHYWSLAIEEQFYLLLPILMIVVHRLRGSLRVLGTVVAVAAAASALWTIHLHRAGASFDRIYFGTDTRLVEILVGSLLAIVLTATGSEFGERTRRAIGVVGVVAFVASFLVWWKVPIDSPGYWGGWQVPFTFTTVGLVLAVLADRGPVPWLYRRPLVTWFGRHTYGIYVYHWPVYLWLTPDRTGLDLVPLLVVRLAVTLALAVLSYRFIEEPIRTRGLPRLGRLQVVAAPAAIALLVGLTATIQRRDAPDPLATIRGDNPDWPITPADGVLDVLLLVDRPDDPVVEAVRALDRENDALRVLVDLFPCTSVTPSSDGPTCASWADRWPALIAEVDPDTVVVYTEGWTADEFDELTGLEGSGTDESAHLLRGGLDLLVEGGARVVLSSPGVDLGEAIGRGATPFAQASILLESDRLDVRRVVQMPDPTDLTRDEWVDASARLIVTNASLYQRVDDAVGQRVLVVGDSQARSLGYGLERWGARTGSATVWNGATEGCGLFSVGVTVDAAGREQPPSDTCRRAADDWSSQIDQFQPDVVVVFTSLWDLQPRRLDGWGDARTIDDPSFAEALLASYRDAVRTFTADGARVVWVVPPCVGTLDDFGSLRADAEHQDDLARLRADVVTPLGADPEVTLFDADAVLCPGGRFRSSIDGIPKVRSDGIHFSVEGSLWFAQRYGAELLDG